MILGLIIGAVAGFVFGVLFGRANKNKVSAALAAAQAELDTLKKKI